MLRSARWLFVVILGACSPEPEPRTESPPPVQGVVDSTFTPEEAMRRFREGLAQPRGLEGGAESREALVRGFVDALARQDTAALIAMHITRAEFAWLYYPHTELARPERYLEPKTVWLLLRLESEKGLTRLVQRPIAKGAPRCEDEPRVEGPNRLWERCRLGTRQLFGTILEREGRFKFVSYKTDL
ncbi:MAG TPA: hypothetical protein VF613_20280 [Longimicrobium sp.]